MIEWDRTSTANLQLTQLYLRSLKAYTLYFAFLHAHIAYCIAQLIYAALFI